MSYYFGELAPDRLLDWALLSPDIRKTCERDPDLRQKCIVAAIRRYHKERLHSETVHNRSEPYVVLLDDFRTIQDEYERRGPVVPQRQSRALVQARTCLKTLLCCCCLVP